MSEPVERGYWIDTWLRPVLVAAMLACLAVPVGMGIAHVAPAWSTGAYTLLSFAANLEGIVSERMLRRRRITGWAYLGSRAAEVLILILVLKLGSYVALGWERLQADAPRWLVAPAEFITTPDLLAWLPFLVLWGLAIHFARLLTEMDVTDEQIPADRSSAEYYLWLTQPSPVRDRQDALERLSELFFLTGILLLAMSAAYRLVFPDEPVPVGSSLGYFAIGIVLLSQAQYGVLHTTWQIQRIPVQPAIARRWLWWAALFLGGVCLVALALPTTYTMGPLRALLGVLSLVTTVVGFILGLIMLVIAYLLSLIFPRVQVPQGPRLQLPTPPPGTATTAANTAWLQPLLSGLFWLVVLAIAGYAVLRFVRDRAEMGQGGWWRRFMAWMGGLWRRWRGWEQGAQARLAARLARRPERTVRLSVPGGFLSLRRLAPRELVRYFYLSTLQRAARAGKPRRAGQTPYEYKAAMERDLPELEPDLSGLTDAFVAARYSPRPVEPEEARAVKPLWERLRSALRRRVQRV